MNDSGLAAADDDVDDVHLRERIRPLLPEMRYLNQNAKYYKLIKRLQMQGYHLPF